MNKKTTEVSFRCFYCRYTSKKYNEWRKHLLEESHQVQGRQRIKMMDLKKKKKSVVVFGLMSVKKKDILKYFGDLAVVTDIVFWKERPDFCIITFLMTHFCEAVLKTKQHTIGEHQLFLRSRADISEVEWISICPFAGTNIKIEVDLVDSTSPEDPFNESSDEAEDDRKAETLDDVTADNGDAEMIVEDQPSKEISQSPINSKQVDNESQAQEFPEECMSQDQDYLETWDTVPGDNQEQDVHVESTNNSDESMVVDRDDIESTNSTSTSHREEYIDEINMTETNERFVFDLNAQMEDLYNANLMPPDAWQVRCRVKEGVELLLRSIYPNCVLIPFGAGSTAISSGREMLSMFVDTMGSTKHLPVDSESEKLEDVHMELSSAMRDEVKKKILRLLNDAIHDDMAVISDIKSRGNQNASNVMEEDEIRFTYYDAIKRVYISCRLQTANFLAVQSCRVMKFYCSLDHRVRPLLILTRQWAFDNRLVQLNSQKYRRKADSIHAVVIQWLTICYMIKRKILPPLPLLQKYSITRLMHTGVNLAFCDDPETLKWKNEDDYEKDPVTGNPSARCILDLARKMFYFYGEPKLEKYVVMTSIGRLIRKAILSGKTNVLHDSYMWKQSKGLHTDSILCVQHPLKLFINMTTNVPASTKRMFQRVCLETASRLQTLLLDSSRMCSVLALLSNHKEIVWHPYQALPHRSSSSAFRVKENCQPENVVESNVQSLGGVAEPKNKKRKLKNFAININFTKKFRNAAKQVTSSRMKAAVETNCRGVWLKFFKDYNRIVWPLCFGIQITELTERADVINQTSMYGQSFGLPFKGVLRNPSKLGWIRSFRDSNADIVFKAMLTEYSQILQQSSNFSDDSIDAIISSEAINDSKMFSFKCRIFVKANKPTEINKATANAVMKFSEVYGTDINSQNRRKRLFKMYSELWEMYSFRRLMNDRYFE